MTYGKVSQASWRISDHFPVAKPVTDPRQSLSLTRGKASHWPVAHSLTCGKSITLTCGKVSSSRSPTTSAALVYHHRLWLIATVTSLLSLVAGMRCWLWVAIAWLGWRVAWLLWRRVARLATCGQCGTLKHIPKAVTSVGRVKLSNTYLQWSHLWAGSNIQACT